MRDHAVTKKEIVKALNLKTEEMARRYISGIAKPRHDKMVKLARLLRYERASDLEYGAVESTTRPKTSARGSRAGQELPEDAREVALAWSKLPDVKKHYYAQAIITDATIMDAYPDIARAITAAHVAINPNYHVLTEGILVSYGNLERQLKLKLEPRK